MKSAYELAMERFGATSAKALTEEQKAALAEIDRKFQGRLAQLDIMRDQQLVPARAQRDAAAIDRINEEWRRDRQSLEAQREAEKDQVRQG